MAVTINKELNKNIIDLLIMQKIAECKLNRIESTLNPEFPFEKFYENYVTNNKSFFKSNGEENTQLLNQLKVAVGSIPDLSQADQVAQDPDYTIPNNAVYEGGAGTYTKLTNSQVEEFIKHHKILDYHGNDNTGFSATIFLNETTGEKTISFRSTEFAEDFLKDSLGANPEINSHGTTFAQSAALVKYIEELKTSGILNSNDVLNVTGYSLGGHLAANFTKFYKDEFNINDMYAFNAPGVGELVSTNGKDPYVALNHLK